MGKHKSTVENGIFIGRSIVLSEIQCEATACLEEGCPNIFQSSITIFPIDPNEFTDLNGNNGGNSEIPELMHL